MTDGIDIDNIPHAVLEEYRSLYYKGQEFLSDGEYRDAIDCFLEAMRLTHPCEVIWGDIAFCYLLLNDGDQCVKALRRSIEINPDYMESLHNLALILRDNDELDEAESLIRRALELDKSQSSSWSVLGQILYKQGRFEDAKRALSTSTNITIDDAITHYYMALTQSEMRMFPEANQSFLTALEIAPDEAMILRDYGAYLISRGRFKSAQQYLRRAIIEDPYDNEPLVLLAEVLIHDAKKGGAGVGDMVDEALTLLNQSFEIDPLYGKAWFHWAEASVFYRKWDAVEKFSRHAIELGYSGSWAYGLLSAALGELGHDDEAAVLFEEFQKRVKEEEALHYAEIFFSHSNRSKREEIARELVEKGNYLKDMVEKFRERPRTPPSEDKEIGGYI